MLIGAANETDSEEVRMKSSVRMFVVAAIVVSVDRDFIVISDESLAPGKKVGPSTPKPQNTPSQHRNPQTFYPTRHFHHSKT